MSDTERLRKAIEAPIKDFALQQVATSEIVQLICAAIVEEYGLDEGIADGVADTMDYHAIGIAVTLISAILDVARKASDPSSSTPDPRTAKGVLRWQA